MTEKPLRARKIYFVLGESSGDALGADLLDSFAELGVSISAHGLAGEKMQARGMSSLFDISEISVMGLSGVAARLPTILRRIRTTVEDICAVEPDVVVLIDSPEFCKRVATGVKAKLPGIRIVKYICPSVWAWRPGRAPGMKNYLDHILAILPFEPEVMRELNGPPTSYIGHPLAWKLQNRHRTNDDGISQDRLLLLLPGSRSSEVKLLLPDFEQTLEILRQRGTVFNAVLPTLPHLEETVRTGIADWSVRPEIIIDEEAREEAFARADVALAASGTVLLELALNRVPMISLYRLDWMMHRIRFLITGWSSVLPNLIADEAFVPERVGDMVRPGWIARRIEALLEEGPARQIQLGGFTRMAERMRQEEAPGILAARKILELADPDQPN